MNEITMTACEVAIKDVNFKLIALNAANRDEKPNLADIAIMQAEVVSAITVLNAAEKAEDFSKLLTSENPALTAIKQGAVTFTALKTPTEKAPDFSLSTKIEVIDLAELKAFADDNSEKAINIFADQRALTFAEGLNHLVLNYSANGMKIKRFAKKLDAFRIKNTADLLKVEPKQENTVKGIKQALQTVTDKITSGLKISDDDTVALLMNYSKWGKELNGVSMPIEASFRRMLTRVLYKVANGTEFVGE